MSKTQVVYSAEFLRKRKLLVVGPLLALPFLFFMFYALGGGRDGSQPAAAVASMGFNTNLPEAKVKASKQEPDKQAYYKQADADSMKRRSFWQQDPYHRQGLDTEARKMGETRPLYAEDPKASALLKQLDRLQEAVKQPPKVAPAVNSVRPVVERSERPIESRMGRKEERDEVMVDPELAKLDGMLDKIMRIQHPEEGKKIDAVVDKAAEPDTASNNSLLAVVEVGQELVAGTTIGLRLETGARVGGVVLPKGLVVYGVVSIQGDRMLVAVNTVRRERSIFSVGLQVYDMDGLPGIHIPGRLGRETAKQSADQAIGTVNPLVYEPGIGAQAANAGIVTAKALLSRKVRAVRVMVPGGYRVLLRGSLGASGVKVMTEAPRGLDSLAGMSFDGCQDCSAYMRRVERSGGMELAMQGVFLQDGLLYFSLRLENRGVIPFLADRMSWIVRDRRQQRRKAIQEESIIPRYLSAMSMLAADSSVEMVAGFEPFALPKDRELVLTVTEESGARILVMKLNHRDIMKARRVL